MMILQSQYQIKNYLHVFKISVDRNCYFLLSYAINPVKAFILHIYEHTFQWQG